MRRVKDPIPLAECKRRALVFLLSRDRREYVKASQVAGAIWGHGVFLRTQGAGAAASRVLKAMQLEGTARWCSNGEDWGYQAIRGQLPLA
jgi:hypothetical protein